MIGLAIICRTLVVLKKLFEAEWGTWREMGREKTSRPPFPFTLHSERTVEGFFILRTV